MSAAGGAADWVAVTGATPGPVVPELQGGLDPQDVSPGLFGFLAIFLVALACIPLFRSMTSKIRGVNHRAPAEDDGVPPGPSLPEGTDGSPR